MIYSDRNLAQKLELTEAHSNAAFVEARAKMFPASTAEWTEVAGAYAMFDGTESPLTFAQSSPSVCRQANLHVSTHESIARQSVAAQR